MIKISLRSPTATRNVTEWVSLCILIGLAMISIAAAFEHVRHAARPPAPPVRTAIRLKHVTPAPAVIYQTNPAPAIPVPDSVTTPVEEKTPEPPEIARIDPPVGDMNGEADRTAPAGTAVVIGRQKDLPLLRDDQAFETWGGEFAEGDSRLKEMIQAGALTSVQRGARVRILEVRGKLAHVEVEGQDRTGWIRSSFIGR
jgi:hypothetical protein